jgi:hypothetical protein
MRRNERLLAELRAHLKRLLKIKQVVESCIDAFRIMATESCKIAAFEDTIVKDLTIFDFVLALASSSERGIEAVHIYSIYVCVCVVISYFSLSIPLSLYFFFSKILLIMRSLKVTEQYLHLKNHTRTHTHTHTVNLPEIVHPALRYLSLVVGLRQRSACKQLVIGDGVYFALSCLQIHSGNAPLMSAALRLLVLAAKIDGDVTTGGPSPNHGVADAVSRVRLPPKHKTSKAALHKLKSKYTTQELKKKQKEGLEKFREEVESVGGSIGGPPKEKNKKKKNSSDIPSPSSTSIVSDEASVTSISGDGGGENEDEDEEDDGSLYSMLSKYNDQVTKTNYEVTDEDIDEEHDIGQVHPVEVCVEQFCYYIYKNTIYAYMFFWFIYTHVQKE